MEKIIKISELKKSYEEVQAVRGTTLHVNKGEMFGLVGPDGAGKTTTIRILCGLLNKDSGKVEMLGNDISQKNKIQKHIGYLSQTFSLYGDLTVDENIEFFAEIHDVKKFKNRRNELLEFTRLIKFRNRPAEKLSGGMKQKLALACSLIHEPEILFLDEPTTGVDPVSRRDFWKILSGLQKQGITIFMTTPYLDEAERCNRVALMNNGEIIAMDTPIKIKEQIHRFAAEIICTNVKKANSVLKDYEKYDPQMFGDRINVLLENYEQEIEEIKNILIQNGIEIKEIRKTIPSLENVFIHLIKN